MLFVLWFDMNYFWQKGNYIFMNILIKNIKPKLIVNGKFISTVNYIDDRISYIQILLTMRHLYLPLAVFCIFHLG